MVTTLATSNGNGTRETRRTGRSVSRPKTLCPSCLSSDRVEKVSSVVRRGRGRLVWENGEVAHYETELAQVLALPSPPKGVSLRSTAVAAILPLLILGATLFALHLLRSQHFVSLPPISLVLARDLALVWFGVIIPGAVIGKLVRSNKEVRKQKTAWIAARHRWSGLYYCSNDEVVFTPGALAGAPLDEIGSLLFPVFTVSEAEPPTPIAAGRRVSQPARNET